MKTLYAFLMTSFFFSSPTWKTNFEEAKVEATKDNKLILVNFSGSDWCSPCIQLKKTIFDSEAFEKYASEKLVLVIADFPREAKHRLSPEQKKMNEILADKFDPKGRFPYTLLISSDGKVLREWEGLPEESDKQFVEEIKQIDVNR